MMRRKLRHSVDFHAHTPDRPTAKYTSICTIGPFANDDWTIDVADDKMSHIAGLTFPGEAMDELAPKWLEARWMGGCPKCGSSNYEGCSQVTVSGVHAYQECKCLDCGTVWDDVYVMMAQNLQVPRDG
jgi:hypothetical protein